jgi:hypothetical protein
VSEIRARVSELIGGEPVTPARFKGYVNELSLNKSPLLERVKYGRYRLLR